MTKASDAIRFIQSHGMRAFVCPEGLCAISEVVCRDIQTWQANDRIPIMAEPSRVSAFVHYDTVYEEVKTFAAKAGLFNLADIKVWLGY